MSSCSLPAISLTPGFSRVGVLRWHRRTVSTVSLALTLLALVSSTLPTRADVVTNYVTGCTEDELLTALTGDVIVFTNTIACSITLSQPITIADNKTLIAVSNNVTITGGNQLQLFAIDGSARLTAVGLTFAGGSSTNGGALYVNPSATAWLINCIMAGNSAAGTNGTDGTVGSNSSSSTGGNGGNGTAGIPGLGGAIYNLGTVALQYCTLTNNSATGGNGGAGGAGGTGSGTLSQGGNGGSGGGGAPAYGGAIYNLGNLTLTNCTFAGNTVTAGNGGAGGAGGGGGFVGLAGSGAAGGKALGGGICNASNLTVRACTFSADNAHGGTSAAGGNQSNGTGTTGANGGDALGAGLYNGWFAQVLNCTFYNDTAAGGTGGNGGPGSGTFPTGGRGGNGGSALGGGVGSVGGTFNMTNCTVVNCNAIGGTNGAAGSGTFAGSPGNPGAANGGGIANSSGSFTLANTLLATNLSGLNASGTFTSGGYNLSSDSTPTSLTPLRGDALIGALANNGGPTMTVALRSSASLAYGKIPVGHFPLTDQRGFFRGTHGGADIGAYEVAAPTISIDSPSYQSPTNGGSVTFTVLATGDAPLRYQWQFNQNNISGASGSTFTVAAVTNGNTGPYRVMVTNLYGTAISSPVTVHFAPGILVQPTNQTVAAGSPATFNVAVSGDANFTYQWQLYGTNVYVTTGGPTNTYPIDRAQPNQAGPYQVVITNNYGASTSAVAILTVTELPAISTQPTNLVVAVGNNATFVVGATGTSLTYQWTFNGTNISGATQSSYTRVNAQTNHAGTYLVTVSSGSASLDSDPATLTVLYPPAIATPPQSQVVAPGQNVTFTVSATGDNLTYQWSYQGSPRSGATTSSYTVNNAQPSDSGTYSITVANAARSTNSAATLRVLATPVITNASSSAGGFSFSFFGYSNLTYAVQYTNRLGSSSNWPTAASYSGSNAPITFQDSPTNPSRFYRVQVR